jgi:hypothetical protein
MHFYMHSYVDKNFILVKSGCHRSLHEPVHRFGYDVYHRLPESTGQALNYQNPPNAVSKPSPEIPILHINKENNTTDGVTIE